MAQFKYRGISLFRRTVGNIKTGDDSCQVVHSFYQQGYYQYPSLSLYVGYYDEEYDHNAMYPELATTFEIARTHHLLD